MLQKGNHVILQQVIQSLLWLFLSLPLRHQFLNGLHQGCIGGFAQDGWIGRCLLLLVVVRDGGRTAVPWSSSSSSCGGRQGCGSTTMTGYGCRSRITRTCWTRPWLRRIGVVVVVPRTAMIAIAAAKFSRGQPPSLFLLGLIVHQGRFATPRGTVQDHDGRTTRMVGIGVASGLWLSLP